jgi:hypothetical protein
MFGVSKGNIQYGREGFETNVVDVARPSVA